MSHGAAASSVVGTDRSFEAAVGKLMELQTSIKPDLTSRRRQRECTLGAMHNYMERVGVRREDLYALRAVHIAGTKGKGSTTAMTESVLRSMGYRTGMFTSPHLVTVRERFRLNGESVSEDVFRTHFWECWDALDSTRDQAGEGMQEMPHFFRFLTLMGIRMFLREGVDVAVMEVGIGGRLDATNVLPKPVVCGVTSLGFDHVSILGDTLAKIAGEKAGIFKRDVPAVVMAQETDAMHVLQRKAVSLDAPFFRAPALDAIAEQHGDTSVALSLSGDYQRHNAALAVSLAHVWEKHHKHVAAPVEAQVHPEACSLAEHCVCFPPEVLATAASSDPPPPPAVLDVHMSEAEWQSTKHGLATVHWPGRAQTLPLRGGGVTLFIDGAHTAESMDVCMAWFAKEAAARASDNAESVLLFNCTPGRTPRDLLRVLHDGHAFDRVQFVPNNSDKAMYADLRKNLQWQHDLAAQWADLSTTTSSSGDTTLTHTHTAAAAATPTVHRSIRDALLAEHARATPERPVHVLCTGSLYLVGGVLEDVGKLNLAAE